MTFAGRVKRTAELERILALPRRRIDDPALLPLCEAMSEALRRPGGTMILRPAQALALLEIGQLGGGFIPVEVGGGKTLISLLAAWVLDARRPLLTLPAKLIRKTEDDIERYGEHFVIPNHIRMISYEVLGRKQSADELDDYDPDLIIGDEVHKLKNRDAAVTRRVEKRFVAKPQTRAVWLSGTIMDQSVNEFGHLAQWSLGAGSPVPRTVHEREDWGRALDTKTPEYDRPDPGALLELCTPADRVEHDPLTSARRGFRRRLLETPGIVSTIGEGEHVGASLQIRALPYKVSATTEAHFEKLRHELKTPDDWDITPVDVWRHARELALGFHNVWDPRPPEPWRQARRAWFAFVREVLARTTRWDSPDHVKDACLAGQLPSGVLMHWLEIEPTFKPNPVPIWHDDSALEVVSDWMRKPGIVWVDHGPFGVRLAERTGARYYRQDGLDTEGNFIDHDNGKRSIIASVKANKEGRNLQHAWHRNLVTAPTERPGLWQQMIGRTHRPGQRADEVIFDILLGCVEHASAFRAAIAGARVVRDMTGAQQKLLIADIDWPGDDALAALAGARWNK